MYKNLIIACLSFGMLCNAKEHKKECSPFDRPHAGTRTIVLSGIACVCWAISDMCADQYCEQFLKN